MAQKTPDLHLRRALEALGAAARERIEKHPSGHLLRGRKGRLELPLPIPLGPSADGAFEDALRETEALLDAELEGLLRERSLFCPGRIHCLRCASSECEHSRPRDAREIFAGYGSSGLPRFVDLGQWLLERQHPHLDRIYTRPPKLVTEVVSGRELSDELLAVYRDEKSDFQIHGQVTAGWFPVIGPDKMPEVLALSFQVLSTRRRTRRAKGARRRLVLNVLGRGVGGEPLEELYARMNQLPWKGAVDWAQQVLATIENSQGKKSASKQQLSRRVEGMLSGLARRLEQGRRARDRRTGHAEKRHGQGDRPTRMAMTDLERAGDDRVLADVRKKTLIVLGEKGRAHVFNAEGKLVTSIRYSPESIERKIRQEIWRQATPEEVMGLRKNTGAGEAVS